MSRPIFIGGTSSHAGKSWMTTAICAWLRQQGVRVAPFKAQNMSNNSYPCRAGGEIGRAQAAQAWACGLEPEPAMNSILLKPNSDGSSQVIVNGQVWKNLSARDYYGHHPELLVAASGRGFGRNAEAVLIVQMDVLGVRKHPEAGTLGTLLPDVATFVEQRSIAAELVYREGAQQSTFFGGQQIDGPDGAFHD